VKRINIASVARFFIAILIFTSCAKVDTTDLGLGLIPAVDGINTLDTTLSVLTNNKLFTDTTRMIDQEDHGVGIIENDPEFGKTSASLYSSFTPAAYRAYPFVNRDSVVIDSVVLSLAYTATYGDSNAVQQFEVREIDNRFNKFPDSSYRLTRDDFPVRDEVLGLANVNFRSLRDSVQYRNIRDTITKAGELRIRLDTSWARKFVGFDTTNAYSGDSLFKANYFAGLRVTATEASPNKNAIAYFTLEDNERTRITFYCHVQNNGRTDTIAPTFAYHSDPHANIIRRTPMNDYLANVTNGTDNDEKLYIQSAPGSYAEVKIPGLDLLDNRVIHRAELIFEKYPSTDLFFNPPTLMFVDAFSTTGDSAFTIRNDFVPVNASPGYDVNLLGGIYRNNQYVFNLTRYVQSIVTKKLRNYTLRVYAPFTTQPNYMIDNTDQAGLRTFILVNSPVAAGRVVLYGGGSTDPRRVRLRIIYSKI